VHRSSLLAARALVVLLVAACWTVAEPGRARADSGAWSWPLAGPHEVSRPFAPPATRYGPGHRGADLPGAAGDAVRAAGAGRVSYAGLLAGRGVVVVVHGALRTTYEPVTATVAVGALVEPGEQLGRLDAGHAGCAAQACLHWGLRRGEDYLDPVRLVERGPVRLLPLGPEGALPVGTADAGPARTPGDAGGTVPGGPESAAERAAEDSGGGAERSGREPARTQAPSEPGWSLRAAEAPLGAVAVAALVVGVGLLARPRPFPDGPPSAAAAAAAPPRPEPGEPVAPVLELSAARDRRRSA